MRPLFSLFSFFPRRVRRCSPRCSLIHCHRYLMERRAERPCTEIKREEGKSVAAVERDGQDEDNNPPDRATVFPSAPSFSAVGSSRKSSISRELPLPRSFPPTPARGHFASPRSIDDETKGFETRSRIPIYFDDVFSSSRRNPLLSELSSFLSASPAANIKSPGERHPPSERERDGNEILSHRPTDRLLTRVRARPFLLFLL